VGRDRSIRAKNDESYVKLIVLFQLVRGALDPMPCRLVPAKRAVSRRGLLLGKVHDPGSFEGAVVDGQSVEIASLPRWHVPPKDGEVSWAQDCDRAFLDETSTSGEVMHFFDQRGTNPVWGLDSSGCLGKR
jgi:hypothetical protein